MPFSDEIFSKRRIGATIAVPLGSYTTTFSGTENPISESGNWANAGSNWTQVRTSGGIAFGTQTSPANTYDDSYAYLPALGAAASADQLVYATLQKGTPSGFQECEVLMRWSTNGTNSTTGYEALIAHDGAYCALVKWNGALGDFTYVALVNSPGVTPVTGSVLKAQIVGIHAKVWLDSTLIIDKDVNTDSVGGALSVISSGSPGIGFYRENTSGAADQFGMTDYTAQIL